MALGGVGAVANEDDTPAGEEGVPVRTLAAIADSHLASERLDVALPGVGLADIHADERRPEDCP